MIEMAAHSSNLLSVIASMERDDADEVYRLGLAEAEATPNIQEAAALLSALANWFEERNDLDRAILLRRRTLDVLSGPATDPRMVAIEIESLAETFERTGNWQTAIELMHIASRLTRMCEGADSAAYHDQLQHLADLLEVNGHGDKSEVVRDEAKALERKHSPGAVRDAGLKLDHAESAATKPEVRQVDIFYATNRNPEKRNNPYRRYGGQRHNQLNMGIATVSVPRNRQAGDLALPPWYLRFDGVDDEDYFLLKDVRPLGSRDAWLDRLRERVQRSGRREILLFIHGFNTSFWQAMLRAAQLHVDLGIDGTTAAYSWPSRGWSLSYDSDRTGIDVYWPVIKDLITDLAKPYTSPAAAGEVKPRLIIVAHSMGCDYLLKALDRLKEDFATGKLWGTSPPISEIVFAAPDVDATVFKRDLPAIRPLAERVTAYCSEADVALWLSMSAVHKYERAGSKAEELASTRIDSIDTTVTPGAWLWSVGHCDYASTAIVDLQAVLCGDRCDQRIYLDPVKVAGGTYWGLNRSRLGSPEGQAYVSTIRLRRPTPELADKLTT